MVDVEVAVKEFSAQKQKQHSKIMKTENTSMKPKTNDTFPWNIGANYLIRTATMIDTGRLVAVTEKELVLEDAAWIADTGRFSNALSSGVFDEVEPFHGRVIIGRASLIDATEIPTLPREQK